MTDLERLLAIEDIKRVKARYFYCLDHRDWDGWRREVFTPNATLLPSGGRTEPLVGVEAIIAYVSSVTTGQVSVHHGHMPDIEILSETDAKGIWAMEDQLKWENGGPQGMTELRGYGHYHDSYVRTPAGWRIASSHLTRLRVERS